MYRNRKRWSLACLALAAALALSGCGGVGGAEQAPGSPVQSKPADRQNRPPLPDKLRLNEEKVPMLQVYQVDEEEILETDIESYLLGVVAGEMKNDWPLEALKAQAILARTFVLKFCTEKESKYHGADISTDIEEAQAYDATGINDRIERAVGETRGLVLSYRGELPYAWFHAHSGGMTERAVEGLHYDGREPGYTQVTEGLESSRAPADARAWQASFPTDAFLAAAKKAGYDGPDSLNTLKIGQQGDSGRAVTLTVNGREVSAPELRLALGSQEMRSTWLTDLQITDNQVVMKGRGYGHGVGMPQWGAYGMAEAGKSAQEIVTYYFQDVTVEKLW